MQPELQSTYEGTASLRLIDTGWSQPKQTAPLLRLRPSVSRGIAGRLIGIADLCALSLTLVYCALWAVAGRPADDPMALLSMRMSVAHFCMLAFCWMIWRSIFFYCGLYTWQHIQSVKSVLGRVALATGLSSLVEAQIISRQWHHGHFLHIMLFAWIVCALCAVVSRVAVGAFHIYVRPHLRRPRNAVIVGSIASAARATVDLKAHTDWNYRILGVVDSSYAAISRAPLPILGRVGDLEDILMREPVDEVIVTLSAKLNYSIIEHVIKVCERVGVQVQYPEDLFDISWSNHCHRDNQDQPQVVLKMVREDYRHRIKRAIDITGAMVGLFFGAPLFLIVAILIKATSKGPILFTQDRYGLGRRIFRIYKFRTMFENAEAAQARLEHMNQNSGPVFKIFKDPRVTRVGEFLRKTSIDELPQLINVLKGEMSLVGPRPLNKRDVSRFSEARLMRRFSVKPGLTCLWQISGRSNLSFDRWIALDLHYIDQWSLQMDLRILAMTLPAVIKGTGAA
ncbi:MAG: sugar transferase [Terracidiphilus sp.]